MPVFPNFSRRPSSRIVPLVFLFLGLSVLIIFLYALHSSSSKPVIQTNDALWHDTILCHAMGQSIQTLTPILWKPLNLLMLPASGPLR